MPKPSPRRSIAILFCSLVLFALTGCSSLIVDPMLPPFTRSLEQQSNLDLLHDGTPSLLLLLDGLLANDPDDRALLTAGAKAYASYALLLTQFEETEQARTYAERGRELAQALLATIPALAGAGKAGPEELQPMLAKVRAEDAGALFWGGYGWAVWVRFQQGSPEALAALTRIEPIMARVLELDESYHHGSAHLFLGALYGAKPALFGGNPVASRAHFERALALGQRRFLTAQVTFAETYARQMFDRELFQSLLEEVLAAPLDASPDLKASNSLAKMKARQLIEQIDTFF
ncbi:MAG: TRAP transporter TatT component family protein [Desulfobulbaceae bacterium]|nr:TRAP transporter TatT component family protein [Desulfobulbaceae bacterium]